MIERNKKYKAKFTTHINTNIRPLLTATVEYIKKSDDVLFSAGTTYEQHVSALAREACCTPSKAGTVYKNVQGTGRNSGPCSS